LTRSTGRLRRLRLSTLRDEWEVRPEGALLCGEENGVVKEDVGTSPVRESGGTTQRRRDMASDEGASTPVLARRDG
jgi:hypothetical protein